jgi:hypothetical protein
MDLALHLPLKRALKITRKRQELKYVAGGFALRAALPIRTNRKNSYNTQFKALYRKIPPDCQNIMKLSLMEKHS